MKTKFLIPTALVLVVIAFIVGRMSRGHNGHDHQVERSAAVGNAAEFWTCSMHPQIKQPDPGKCPICAMELVPVFKNVRCEPCRESDRAVASRDPSRANPNRPGDT